MTSFAALSSSLSSCYLSPPSLLTSSSRLLHSSSPSPSVSALSSPSSSSSAFSSSAFSSFSGLQRPAGAARLRRVNAQRDGASGSSRTENKPNSEETPSWAKPGSEELPPWAKNEAAQPVSQSGDLPFFVYLIASCLVAIAAVRYLQPCLLFSPNLLSIWLGTQSGNSREQLTHIWSRGCRLNSHRLKVLVKATGIDAVPGCELIAEGPRLLTSNTSFRLPC